MPPTIISAIFPAPAGPVSYIRQIIEADLPRVEEDGPDGWIAITTLADADPDDLAMVLAAADTAVVTQGMTNRGLTVAVGKMAQCGFRVLLIEGPDEGPSPSETIEVLAQMMRTRASRSSGK